MPEARGRGHAGALLDWCAEEGRRLGVPRSCTWIPAVGPERQDAHRLYFNASGCRIASRTTSRGPSVASRPCPPPRHTLRHTPLFERHERAGARLVPFAGWEMPVQYEGIRPEHVAVRTGAGMFDVSHMGEIETRGPRRRPCSSACSPTT